MRMDRFPPDAYRICVPSLDSPTTFGTVLELRLKELRDRTGGNDRIQSVESSTEGASGLWGRLAQLQQVGRDSPFTWPPIDRNFYSQHSREINVRISSARSMHVTSSRSKFRFSASEARTSTNGKLRTNQARATDIVRVTPREASWSEVLVSMHQHTSSSVYIFRRSSSNFPDLIPNTCGKGVGPNSPVGTKGALTLSLDSMISRTFHDGGVTVEWSQRKVVHLEIRE